MRPVDPYTAERFAASSASLCTCWRIIRADGVELGFTDHDRDISFTGTTFSSVAGASGSALEASAGLSADNSEIVGVFGAGVFSRADLDAGRFDGAQIQVWRVDWEDPSARLLLRTGWLGDVTRNGEGYTAEFRSLKSRLSQTAGRIYGRTCDASLGDARCGIDLDAAAYSTIGTVETSDADRLTIAVASSRPEGFYRGGTLTFEGGELTGVTRRIRDHGTSGEVEAVTLWDALPSLPATGAAVRLIAGCDKRLETCRDKFANVLNFRGFPYIPGTDILTVTARPGDGE